MCGAAVKGGGGDWHKAMVLVCLTLAAPIDLSPLHIPTHCGSERVPVVSTEPLDDLSCFTPPGSAEGGGGGWHKASVSDCLPLAAPIGLSPLLTLTLCGSKRVLVVSTEPLDDLSYLTTPGLAVPETGRCPCR